MLTVKGEPDARNAHAFQTWSSAHGVSAPDQCATLQASEPGQQKRPTNVLDVEEHEQAASRDCIWRYKSLVGKNAAYIVDLSVKTFGDRANSPVIQKSENEKRYVLAKLEQAQALKRDFTRHNADTEPPFAPILNDRPLGTTSSLDELSSSKQGFSEQQKVAISSAVLDLYGSCVHDAKDQFRLSLETWKREQDPRLKNGRNDALRAECQVRFSEAQQRVDRIVSRDKRSAGLAAQLAALEAPTVSTTPAPKPTSVVGLACSASSN